MHIPRIYVDQQITLNQTFELPKETAVHITTVLKRKVGQNVILFNNVPDVSNQLGEYTAQIILASKNKVTVKIIEYLIKDTKSQIPIELAQCISKASHFEVTLQKSVELGVHTITPIISERSEVLRKESFDSKMERWKKIIVSATEQCGRTDLPILNTPVSLQDWLNQITISSDQLLLALCTRTDKTIHDLNLVYQAVKQSKVIIGPEGGLSQSEMELLDKFNFNSVKLGKRILRTETAGITIISILQFVFDEF